MPDEGWHLRRRANNQMPSSSGMFIYDLLR